MKVVNTYQSFRLPLKAPGVIRVICQSDTHGSLAEYNFVSDADIYIHAGDFTSHGSSGDCRKFHDYVAQIPIPHKFVIAGNHDVSMHESFYATNWNRFSKRREFCRDIIAKSTAFTYLEDSGAEVLGLKIWGSPWQPEFCNWAFNLPRGEELQAKWDLIPTDTDILITHGPPAGILDNCEDGRRVGCEELRKTVLERVKPLVHVFGHIHHAYGVATREENMCFVNAATCTESYRATNPPITIDLQSIT